MDRTTEKGHSGVQVHSRGPIFPCVIMRTEHYEFPGDLRPKKVWTLILPNGCRVDHSSWESAYEHGITDANHYNQRRSPAYRLGQQGAAQGVRRCDRRPVHVRLQSGEAAVLRRPAVDRDPRETQTTGDGMTFTEIKQLARERSEHATLATISGEGEFTLIDKPGQAHIALGTRAALDNLRATWRVGNIQEVVV